MPGRKDTIVCGLGNPLMTDEGVGLHITWNLMRRAEEYGDIDFLDMGASMMAVVHAIAGRKKAILIDCARMKESPGAIRRFAPDDVTSTKTLPNFSLHEGDLLNALELSRKMGEYPQEVLIYAIQPDRIEPGESLSPLLSSRLDSYVDMVCRELGERQNA